MESVLHGNPDKPITLVVKRDEKFMKFATVLESNDQKPEQGRLGIYQALPTTKERIREPFYKAVVKAPGMTIALTGFIITETIRVVHEMSWKQTQRNLGGPVVIGIMAYKSAQRGLYYYLNLFIMISITLAIMNLLPIPILDGGYVAISIIEAIIGRPIPRAILVPILTTFMVLLIMAFIFIFYNDFKTWVLKF